MSEQSIFDICVEPIELYKLLKISDLGGCGGEAKTMISEGKVLVNKKVEVQKRKKIRRGDIIEHNGVIIEVAYNPSKKSAEFISTVVTATKNAKHKKKAKSKATAKSSGSAAKASAERSKSKPASV